MGLGPPRPRCSESPIWLSSIWFFGSLYPAYVRGEDYLAAAYQDFLTLWKDADPDIPILEHAHAEYGKLLSEF